MKTTLIEFTSYDGYSLEGTLVNANPEKAALLFVHGITSSRDELGFHSDYANYLGENGISSLRFDYRYHGVNETPLINLSLCGIVNDIEAAYLALKNNVNENTKSFFVVGTSFGGGLSAFWVDFHKRDEIKKLILNAPVINYEDDVLKRNGLVVNGILSHEAQQQLLNNGFVDSSDINFGRGLINELPYINGIKPIKQLAERVVIFHGGDDEDVPLASSQEYKTNKTTLNIIPGVGHGFGIDIDEDLTHPETKKIHNEIYKSALEIIESCL